MAITKEQFMERAMSASDHPDDFWAKVAGMVRQRSGIGITSRSEYSQRQWNWLQQAKSALTKPWD